jgi:4-hydroxy-4-methyl-2-oxoglutarate aldolase
MDARSSEYYELIGSKLYTSVVADVMDDLGRWQQVMRHDIRPLYEDARVVGRAATMLACEVYQVPEKPFELELELLDSLADGEVVVCTAQGSTRAAMWGELLSTHTRARGGRGAILDGLTRDAWGIVDMRFPVFATGRTPADSKGRLDVMAVRVPIDVGGVLVHDGDLVVGDVDGCLAVPQDIESEVIERALAKVEGENAVREVLREGASIRQVFADYGIL